VDCNKYEHVTRLMQELYDAAVQETTSLVIPGESPRFRLALRELDGLSEDNHSFSNAALGEIRGVAAMIQTMHIRSLEPGSSAQRKHHAELKKTIPERLAERLIRFEAIRKTDCVTS
jgi:hypothetical protein